MGLRILCSPEVVIDQSRGKRERGKGGERAREEKKRKKRKREEEEGTDEREEQEEESGRNKGSEDRNERDGAP